MQAYISISYSKRSFLRKELQLINDLLNQSNIQPFVFADTYIFDTTQEQQMMTQAFMDIDKSDFLIAETSDKGIGIGIEVGYARAKQKPVIYLRQATAEHSTTVSGTSDYQIIYTDTNDLQQQLKRVLHKIADK